MKGKTIGLTTGSINQGMFVNCFDVVNGKDSAKVQNLLCKEKFVGRDGDHHQVGLRRYGKLTSLCGCLGNMKTN